MNIGMGFVVLGGLLAFVVATAYLLLAVAFTVDKRWYGFVMLAALFWAVGAFGEACGKAVSNAG